jgi:hypothetical protein
MQNALNPVSILIGFPDSGRTPLLNDLRGAANAAAAPQPRRANSCRGL